MTATASDEATETKGNKKLSIIIVAAAAVVLLAAGFVAFMMLKPKTVEADPAKEPGAIVTMENAMTLNLADGKFLKTGLALELSKKATTALGGEKAVAAFDTSKARDAAIQILGKYKYSELLVPKTREVAQQTLSQEVSKRYDGDVLRVYFTEFVMQ